MGKPILKLSVRELAQYATASGDLLGGYSSAERAQEGSRLHRRLQNEYKSNPDFSAEVFLSCEIEQKDYILSLSGRADGIIRTGNSATVTEIKTTYLDLAGMTGNENPAYTAQLESYGYIYAQKEQLEQITLSLLYYNLATKQMRTFSYVRTFDELKREFFMLVDDYTRLSDVLMRHRAVRDCALATLAFPFKSFRAGQRELAGQVYTAIKEKNTLYAQAPTGTGKTAATLFPALKALGKGYCQHVFYLTAKAQTATVALDTLDILRSAGLPLKSVYITAKDKACLLPERNCNPDFCPYCRDYLKKEHDALPEILQNDSFTTESLRETGKKYGICPFEFALTVSEYCDCIVCDYNYVFNPNIRFKRYFGQGNGNGEYAFLLDEAHNLIERVRDTFSCKVSVKEIMRVRRECRDLPRIYKALKAMADAVTKSAEARQEQVFLLDSPPAEVYNTAMQVLFLMDIMTESERRLIPAALNTYCLTLRDITMCFERYSAEYHRCYMENGAAPVLNILCLQTAPFVREGLNMARGRALFTATMEPHDYYLTVLGANDRSYYYGIDSPFPRENLLPIVDDTISTAYSRRDTCYLPVAKRIKQVVDAKKGNYIVYFPSYAFLNRVLEEYRALDGKTRCAVHIPSMSKGDKDAFLAQFADGEPVLGFSVLGGHFGEGVDLPGEKLIGVIIVGVGLPQLSPERELIRTYFTEQGYDGYAYSYIYPGLNRVLQAAGRVIRTSEDRGIVLLIDARFSRPPYTELWPDHWDVKYLSQQEDIALEDLLYGFWGE